MCTQSNPEFESIKSKSTFVMIEPLVTSFVIVGPTPSDDECEASVRDGSGLDVNVICALPEGRCDAATLSQLPSFCFAMSMGRVGASARASEVRVKFFAFTDQVGQRLYCVMLAYDHAFGRYFAPRCVGVLCKRPYVTLFRDYLGALMSKLAHGALTRPLESYVSELLYAVPMPPRGRLGVSFYVDDACFHAYAGARRDFRPFDFSYQPLFQCLDLHNVLRLLAAMMVGDSSILVHSHHPALLALVPEIMQALMHPFQWVQPYIPGLPRQALGMLASPTPCLLGVETALLPSLNDIMVRDNGTALADMDIVVVDLNDNRVRMPPSVPPLPEDPARELRSDVFRELNDDIEDINLAFSEQSRPERSWRDRQRGIHLAFMRFLVRLFGDYRDHWDGAANWLNVEAFVESRPDLDRPFYRHVVQLSQMGQVFLEQRCEGVEDIFEVARRGVADIASLFPLAADSFDVKPVGAEETVAAAAAAAAAAATSASPRTQARLAGVRRASLSSSMHVAVPPIVNDAKAPTSLPLLLKPCEVRPPPDEVLSRLYNIEAGRLGDFVEARYLRALQRDGSGLHADALREYDVVATSDAADVELVLHARERISEIVAELSAEELAAVADVGPTVAHAVSLVELHRNREAHPAELHSSAPVLPVASQVSAPLLRHSQTAPRHRAVVETVRMTSGSEQRGSLTLDLEMALEQLRDLQASERYASVSSVGEFLQEYSILDEEDGGMVAQLLCDRGWRRRGKGEVDLNRVADLVARLSAQYAARAHAARQEGVEVGEDEWVLKISPIVLNARRTGGKMVLTSRRVVFTMPDGPGSVALGDIGKVDEYNYKVIIPPGLPCLRVGEHTVVFFKFDARRKWGMYLREMVTAAQLARVLDDWRVAGAAAQRMMVWNTLRDGGSSPPESLFRLVGSASLALHRQLSQEMVVQNAAQCGAAAGAAGDPVSFSQVLLRQAASLMIRNVDDNFEAVQLEQLRASDAYCTTFCGHVALLRRVRIDGLTVGERVAFFLNVLNAMIVHAYAMCGFPTCLLDVRVLMRDMTYSIGGLVYSIADIYHGVLRANCGDPFGHTPPFAEDDPREAYALRRPEPRVHFAVCWHTRGGPPLREMDPDTWERQLDEAEAEALEHLVLIDEIAGTVSLPPLMRLYSVDWTASGEGILQRVLSKLVAKKKAMLQRLIAADSVKSVRFLPLDFQHKPQILRSL